MKAKLLLFALALSVSLANAAEVRLAGRYGKRMDDMVNYHVMNCNPIRFSDCYHDHRAEKTWETEFWGKYMHSAVPFYRYTKSRALRKAIDLSAADVVSAQLPDGYLGNYREDRRCVKCLGWEAWGFKYTLLGLLYHHDLTGSADSLAAARRLADYVDDRYGPAGKAPCKLWESGCFAGLASCSILEPIVWLYRVTKEKRYLDLAAETVRQMTEVDDPCAPNLRFPMERGIDVADRPLEPGKRAPERNWRYYINTKSYEQMSCLYGLLDYAAVSGRKDLVNLVLATAENIRRTERMITGGLSCAETWCHGATEQTRLKHPDSASETCVLITWMRLCERLLRDTGDVTWADELERTFYNAYLAALHPTGSTFAKYHPFNGHRRSHDQQCGMGCNCCDANGPRGFLSVMDALAVERKDRLDLNLWIDSAVKASVASGDVELKIETSYPTGGVTRVTFEQGCAANWTLALRIPACVESASVAVNGADVSGVTPGAYCRIAREWRKGDEVCVRFVLTEERHALNGCHAVTRGPLVMAKDSRFGDTLVDFETAGNQWSPVNTYETWMPGSPLRFNRMYSSHMVLQRGEPVRLSGFVAPGRTVNVSFRGASASATADAKGAWSAELPAAEAGGPFEVRADDGASSVVLDDVMVGDVWFCTGQSNMWWPMCASGDPEKEIAAADHPNIRLLDVALTGAEEETDEPPYVRGWSRCTPLTARRFSACAYHFAGSLREKLGDVPIGLVGAGWGGPPISHFLPRNGRPNEKVLAQSREALAAAVKGFAEEDRLHGECRALFADAERLAARVARPAADAAAVRLPAEKGVEHGVLAKFSGLALFRREVTVGGELSGRDLVLELGSSALPGVVFFNGVRVGSLKDWDAPVPGATGSLPWRFTVPASAVRSGANRIAVCLGCNERLSWWGALGGALRLADAKDAAHAVDLAGDWTCERLIDVPEVPRTYGGSWCARIHPFFRMPVKGVLFYQGEADSTRPCGDYLADHTRLIRLLREGWGRPELPYYCMQLANHARKRNGENGFCEIREAQRLTAEKVPYAGTACSIDLGDDLNIHPANKREQGRRLALQALAKSYGCADVVADGPSVQNVIRRGRTATVVYRPSKAKLVLKGAELTGFEARGEGGAWTPVKAEIAGDRVNLTAPFDIEDVRYLWQNFPEPAAALFDDTGLPAVPFRHGKLAACNGSKIEPTAKHVPYGSDPKQVINFYRAPGEGPHPLFVYIHGGGWLGGNGIREADLGRLDGAIERYAKMGVSYAVVNYRLHRKLPDPVHDAARAIQFLRAHAAEYGIDKSRILASGFSAGATTSLWLACHPDLADPRSEDPVSRESSRVNAAIVRGVQASIDPPEVRAWGLGKAIEVHEMIRRAGGFSSVKDMDAGYEAVKDLYREFSSSNFVGPDTPPVLVFGGDRNSTDWIHHTLFAENFCRIAREKGAKNVELVVRGKPSRHANEMDFVRDIFNIGRGR